MKPFATVLLALCLVLPLCACATAPVPFPSPAELEAAHYGDFPGDYEGIIRFAPQLALYSPEKCRYYFSAEPRKQAVEVRGRYEYGWGGYVEIGLVDQLDNYLGNFPFVYLIRDDKLVYFDSVNGW